MSSIAASTDLVIKILDYVPISKFVLNVLIFFVLPPYVINSGIYRFSYKDFGLGSHIKICPQRTNVINSGIYRFSYKDFGLGSHIKICPQRTNVRLRIILIWRLAKIFITKSVYEDVQPKKSLIDKFWYDLKLRSVRSPIPQRFK